MVEKYYSLKNVFAQPRADYTEWNKKEKKKQQQILYINIYIICIYISI